MPNITIVEVFDKAIANIKRCSFCLRWYVNTNRIWKEIMLDVSVQFN